MTAVRREAGFSLVELLVAMTITLIVSGAVYGLMASGQTAFRREPALTDRQQNIRVALDLVTRDASMAGMGMGALTQVFVDGLEAFGPASLPSVIRAGTVPDALEILGNDGLCPPLDVASSPGTNIFVHQTVPPCYGEEGLVYAGRLDDPTSAGIHYMECVPDGCVGSDHLKFRPERRLRNWNPPGGFCVDDANCEIISKISTWRYEIAPDRDGVPSLWRSPTGRSDSTGLVTNIPPGDPRPESNWMLVARGIEDMQVQYMNGSGTWSDSPGRVGCTSCASPSVADWNTLVRQVKVVLSARALEPRISGATESAQGTAVRGQLSAVIAPRAAQVALNRANTGLWR